MPEETRPLWGIAVGIFIIVVVGGLFVYGQRQRIAQEKILQAQEETQAEISVEPVAVGVLLPLSGEEKERGIALQKAGLLALKEINDGSGISNRPLAITWKDSACSASAAVTAAQEMLTIEQVLYIFGGICNNEAMAVAPLSTQHRALFMSPSATDPQLSALGGPLFFRTAIAAQQEARSVGKYLASSSTLERVTLISSARDTARIHQEAFSAGFGAGSGRTINQIILNMNAEDANNKDAHAQKIADIITDLTKAKTQAIYFLTEDATTVRKLLAQIKKKGEINTIVLTSSVFSALSKEMHNAPLDAEKEAKATLEGVLSLIGSSAEANDKADSLFAQYRKQTGKEAPYPQEMANFYSQFFLLKEAIEQEGDTPFKVQNHLDSLSDWQHALGTLTFDEHGDRLGDFTIRHIENGIVKTIGSQRLR